MAIKTVSVCTAFLLCAALSAAEVPASANGIPVFNDDFSVKENFVDHWIHKGKVSVVDGEAYVPGNGQITMMAAPPRDFRLKFTLKLVKDAARGQSFGFARFMFGKYALLLRTDGLVCGGKTLGIPGFRMGGRYTFVVEVRKQKDGELVMVRCNEIPGQVISQAVANRTEKDRVTFSPYGCEFAVDDVSVEQLSAENASPNMIVNSSFEHLQEGMPLFYNTQTPRWYTFQRPYDEFLQQIAIDTKEKVSGKNSIRIAFRDGVARTEGIYTFNTGVVKGRPATFSVYLKADRENFPVSLIVWEIYGKWNRKKILLTKEWKRYELVVPAAKENTFRCGIQLETPGTVWMDDLQLELSDKATPYKASSLDALKFADNGKALPSIPPVTVKQLPETPALDGNIDSWTDKASKIEKFYNMTNEPQNHTVAWVGCDADNLYIAVRAFVKDFTRIKKDMTPRDDFGIFGQENMEVLIDPGKSRKEFFQFTVGASGARTDIGKGGDIAWNGNWKSVVKENLEKKSIDYEIAIPLSAFGSSQSSGAWGINIGRHDSSCGEHSCIYPQSKVSFQDVGTFPELRIPEPVMAPYAAEVSNAGLSDKALVCGITDNSGLKRTLRLRAVANGKQIASRDVTSADGKASAAIPLDNAPSAGKVTFFLDDSGGKRISEQTLYVKKVTPVSMTTRFSRYTPSDASACFRIEVSLADASALSAELSCGSVKVEKKAGPFFEMLLPLQSIPSGTHRVTLTLKDRSGKTVAAIAADIVKMELPEGAARINNFSKCLNLNGKNVFCFMPLLGTSGGGNPEYYARMADWLADNGFKQCIFGIGKKHGFQKAAAFLEQAKKHGITVIAWMGWDKKTEDKEILADVEKHNRFGCIAAWKVLDEPELHMKSEEAKQWMMRMMKLIPAYPVFMNNITGGIKSRYADYTTDILMLDDYLTNTEGKTVIANVMPPMDAVVKASRDSRNQPSWFWLSGNNNHNHYREPSGKEQIAQTWGCIATGATGLAYFSGMPSWPGNWNAYKQLNREILALNDAILSEEKTENAVLSDKNMRWMTRRLGGYLYVFAVNVDPASAGNVQVTLPAEYKYADGAEVEFENRKIRLEQNRFSDYFLGYSRHIYKIKLQ